MRFSDKRVLSLALLLASVLIATGCAGSVNKNPEVQTKAPEESTVAVTTEAEDTEVITEAETAAPETTEAVTEAVTEEDTLEVKPLRRTDDWVDMNADYNNPKVKMEDIVEGLISHDVYVGKDGWLFYTDCIEDFQGENLYTDGMLARIAKQVQARADWCEENGMEFYFMITPNKATVYPEKMMSSLKEGETKRIDQVYDYLAANTTVKCIDVRDALAQAKKDNPKEDLYYPLDTHWNSHGGYVAYRAAMEVIEKDFPDMYSFTREDYQIDYFDSHFKDCAYYLGYYDTLMNEGPVYTKLDGKSGKITDHDWSGEFGQFAHGYVDPGTGFRESAYYAESSNRYAASDHQPSLYFVRDSFYMPMATFFRDTFSKVTSCWTTEFPNADIKAHDPDIVIFQCVEAKMHDTFGAKALQNG